MRKILLIMSAVLILLSFAGCKNSDVDETEQTSEFLQENTDEIVKALVKKQHDCLADYDANGMRQLLSADLLLDIDYDVESYMDRAYETLEWHFGTNGSWEMGEMTVKYYDARRVVLTREEYTKDEENNDGFKAPLITEMCEVNFDLFITTDQGDFTEAQSIILVKEDGEWKIW